MSNSTLRSSALYLLTRIGEEGGFSHVLLDQTIRKNKFSQADAGLLTEIVYGTLQNRDLLDYWLQPFVKKQKKMTPWVKWLLYMSLYQMQMLDRVPDHAVINEAVTIAKKKGHKGISSFTNGVLRSIQRNGVPDTAEIKKEEERLSVETSHPLWLVKRWMHQYGEEVTREMCRTNQLRMAETVRVQPMRTTREEVMEELISSGFDVVPSSFSSQGIIIQKGNILTHRLFKEGFVTVQDQSSMLVAEMMDLTPGLTVLDCCAAPGGKTTHIAEKMKDEGRVHAYDLHSKKASLISKKADSLQLTTIQAEGHDARNLQEKHHSHSFDRILVDAPCSGLGVIRSKPDIKYGKKEEDILKLRSIQDAILDEVAPLLKVGGSLVYSTCTVDKHENDEAVHDFLERHPEFAVDSLEEELPSTIRHRWIPGTGIQIFPQDAESDGFFLTRLKRTK